MAVGVPADHLSGTFNPAEFSLAGARSGYKRHDSYSQLQFKQVSESAGNLLNRYSGARSVISILSRTSALQMPRCINAPIVHLRPSCCPLQRISAWMYLKAGQAFVGFPATSAKAPFLTSDSNSREHAAEHWSALPAFYR